MITFKPFELPFLVANMARSELIKLKCKLTRKYARQVVDETFQLLSKISKCRRLVRESKLSSPLDGLKFQHSEAEYI